MRFLSEKYISSREKLNALYRTKESYKKYFLYCQIFGTNINCDNAVFFDFGTGETPASFGNFL